MPKVSLKSFTAAAALAIALIPLWPLPANADNGAEFSERRRGSGFMQDRTNGWFGVDDRRRQNRGDARRQPFQGWWWQQPADGFWDPSPAPTRRAKRQIERNFEPEPEPVQGAEIYDYRPDPLVALGETSLKWPEPERIEPGDRLVNVGPRPSAPENPFARAVFDRLVAGSAGVRVTEAQRKALVAFYAGRKFAPVWFAEGSVSPRAKPVLELMSRAAEEGFDPADYLPPSLGGYSDTLPDGGDREAAARFELGLSAMALRYAMHASGGRIVPNRLSGYHDLNPPTVAPAEALRKLANEEAPRTYLASLHPTHPAYAALKAELAKLEPGDGAAAHVPIEEGATVRPGDEDSRVPRIRARLAQLGQATAVASDEIEVSSLDETVVDPVAGEQPEFGSAEMTGAMEPEIAADGGLLYDAGLQSAVRAFQEQAGLRPDGLIGSRTIAALNASNDIERHRQAIFSMERLRWLPRDLGSKHVLVNQAAFTATVIENGQRLWETKVIVGKPNTQTAVFSDEIETVVFNPYWGVPGSIIVHEMLPYLKRDPDYLDREGYEVVNSAGTVVSSSSVDWWSVSKNRINVGVRQPPGPQNALGELKFLFPNKHSIYMHDTPSKPLFEKSMRAHSHGCVRVENPRHFAELLLGWDQQRLDSELSGGANQSVRLERKVPVHLTYFTAWPDAEGRIVYHNDVYGRDDRLELAFGTSRLAMQ